MDLLVLYKNGVIDGNVYASSGGLNDTSYNMKNLIARPLSR
jgi:hypothetical protein